MDASNLLKPMLSRGELRCIGATTLDEYRQYIEKDPALERRFQQVEPSCGVASVWACSFTTQLPLCCARLCTRERSA